MSWSVAGRTPESPHRLRVLTSFVPLYCFALNVAGGEADVENLLPTGVGPHDYQFTRHDLEKISGADVIIINGLGLENWLKRALIAASSSSNRIAVASANLNSLLLRRNSGIGEDRRFGGGHDGGDINPHGWLDPQIACHYVTNILRALQAADPNHATAYENHAGVYLDRLREVDRELESSLAPIRNRPLLSYHDSFPYFIRRYGLRLAGVIETIPDVDPAPRHLAAILQRARAIGVTALFTEPQFDSRLVRQIAKDLSIPVGQLDPLETGELTATVYETTMRRNAGELQRLLRKL